MIDPTKVLIEYLKKSATPLYTSVGTRIYCPRLPEDFHNSEPALVLFCRSGIAHRKVPVFTPSYQIACYGGSPYAADAKAVYLALHDVLHEVSMESTASGMLMSAHEEIMGQELIDPDTDWPYILTFYQCNMRPN